MGIIKAEGEASIAVAEEDHVGHGTGDEQVGAHIKLLPVQQQRVLDVPGEVWSAWPGPPPGPLSSPAPLPPASASVFKLHFYDEMIVLNILKIF